MPDGSRLFSRHPANPILRAADWPHLVNAVFNPGATVVDGHTVLVCRVEDRRGLSHHAVARSPDGVGQWSIDPARARTTRLSFGTKRSTGGRCERHGSDERAATMLVRRHRRRGFDM
jgi:hypothetical protein